MQHVCIKLYIIMFYIFQDYSESKLLELKVKILDMCLEGKSVEN